MKPEPPRTLMNADIIQTVRLSGGFSRDQTLAVQGEMCLTSNSSSRRSLRDKRSSRFTACLPFSRCSAWKGLPRSLKCLHHFPVFLNSTPTATGNSENDKTKWNLVGTKVFCPHVLSHLPCEEEQKGTYALKYPPWIRATYLCTLQVLQPTLYAAEPDGLEVY